MKSKEYEDACRNELYENIEGNLKQANSDEDLCNQSGGVHNIVTSTSS